MNEKGATLQSGRPLSAYGSDTEARPHTFPPSGVAAGDASTSPKGPYPASMAYCKYFPHIS